MQPTRQPSTPSSRPLASINGIVLHMAGEQPDAATLRQRACQELLRQTAMVQGLLDACDPAPVQGILTESASAAIETLLEREIRVPDPDDTACKRHYLAQPARYLQGELVHLRHILFAVTPRVDVVALRERAEATLRELRGPDRPVADAFAQAAELLSNCSSGMNGGDLGWLTATDCVPEFARQIFGLPDTGVLPRLVHSRFGLHLVEVLDRKPGTLADFNAVREAVSLDLRNQSFSTALRQYLCLLAGAADLEGVDLIGADSPLVQ